MEMTDVFAPKVANLSGIDGKMDLYVSAVVHQALVEVDEQGTVVAAATAASVGAAQCGGASPMTGSDPPDAPGCALEDPSRGARAHAVSVPLGSPAARRSP